MSNPIGVLHNALAGGTASRAVVQAAFALHRTEVVFFNIKQKPATLVRQMKAAQLGAIVAAGGDGTVSAAASLAVTLGLPLGVLPLGTLNHFAKDLKLPLNLKRAVAVIASGSFKAIDYGSVGGHVFVNNSSLGIYPSVVLDRHRSEGALGKWLAAGLAIIRTGLRYHYLDLDITSNGSSAHHKTPLVFVGNNAYQLDAVGLMGRTSLTAGRLFLYVVKTRRLSLPLRVVGLSLLGRRGAGDDVVLVTGEQIRIRSSKATLSVALDGEVRALRTPLVYQIHPASLKVFVSGNDARL